MGFEPTTSRVTGECSNQAELPPQLGDVRAPHHPSAREDGCGVRPGYTTAACQQ